MMLIESDNGRHLARVEEDENGCVVYYYNKIGKRWNLIHQSNYPVPFHTGLDIAHDVVNEIR